MRRIIISANKISLFLFLFFESENSFEIHLFLNIGNILSNYISFKIEETVETLIFVFFRFPNHPKKYIE